MWLLMEISLSHCCAQVDCGKASCDTKIQERWLGSVYDTHMYQIYQESLY